MAARPRVPSTTPLVSIAAVRHAGHIAMLLILPRIRAIAQEIKLGIFRRGWDSRAVGASLG